MPLARITGTGKVGVNKDLSSSELPPNAWTNARNMRFLDGLALQFGGHGEVYPGTPAVPLHVSAVYLNGQRAWLYASATDLYLASNSGHTVLTRATGGPYAGAVNTWTSTSLAGIPIFNDGVNPPQRWDLNTSDKFVTLDNWPTGTTCKAIRAFNNQLVALGVTQAGTPRPFYVLASSLADPGSLPLTWDPTDPTQDAVDTNLAQGSDPIVDGLQLGQSFMIYKENSCWRMDYAGGQFVDTFTKVLGTSGSLNLNCAVEIDGYHVVLTGDDVIVHDGQSAESVLDKQTRRFLFSSIYADGVGSCFVFKNTFLNEVFICYPTAGIACDTAMVWNYKDRTVSFRDIPNLYHAEFGALSNGLSQPWATKTTSWASDVTTWASASGTPSTARVLMASADQKLYLLDSNTTFDGATPSTLLERRGLNFGQPEARKLIKGVRPRISGADGDTIMVSVGDAPDPYADPVYQPATPFVIGSGIACDVFVDSRYPAIKFEGETVSGWRLDSFDVDYEVAGWW